MRQEQARVLWNASVGPDVWHMGVETDGYGRAFPGQFVTLHLEERHTPLLRRPFSIHRFIRSGGTVTGIELLYKVIGNTTQAMTELKTGETVDLTGPLGRGFDIGFNTAGAACLVGGGIGLAPLMALADRLRETAPDRTLHLMAGGATQADLVRLGAFEAAGCAVQTATMDGSTGDRGTVIVPLERFLKTGKTAKVFSCGPMPMLRAVAFQCWDRSVACEVSLETVMACGMGACLGCAVPRPDSDTAYFHACIDGPIFDAAVFTPPRGS